MSDVFSGLFGAASGGADYLTNKLAQGPTMRTHDLRPQTLPQQPMNPEFSQNVGNMLGPMAQQSDYQQQPQQHQQYFQQMHKGMDSMNEALQQIEQMSMPGQQYGGGQRLGPFQGGNSGKFANAGTIGRMLF